MKHVPLSLFLAVIVSGCEQSPTSNPDPEVVAKLEEIVTVRERDVEIYGIQLDLGTADGNEQALIDLSKARIELADEKGDRGTVIEESQKIVDILTRRFDREKELMEEDRVSGEEIARLHVELLKAEVRLLRAKKNP